MENEINTVLAESNTEKNDKAAKNAGAKSPSKYSIDQSRKTESPSNNTTRPLRRRISPPASSASNLTVNNSEAKDRYNRPQRSPIRGGDRSPIRSSRRNINNYTSNHGSRSDRYHRRRSRSRSRSPYKYIFKLKFFSKIL